MSTSARNELNRQLLKLHQQAADFLERNMDGENGFPIDELRQITLSAVRLGDTSRQEETFQNQLCLFESKEQIEGFETIPYFDDEEEMNNESCKKNTSISATT